MLYNYDYLLPVIISTYKSNYGKGRKDLISDREEFYKLNNYSLYKINKTIKVYDVIIKKLHDISFYNLTPFKEKVYNYNKVILKELNLILDNNRIKTDLDLITIEHFFMDRREKLLIVKENKLFEREMHMLAKRAISTKINKRAN